MGIALPVVVGVERVGEARVEDSQGGMVGHEYRSFPRNFAGPIPKLVVPPGVPLIVGEVGPGILANQGESTQLEMIPLEVNRAELPQCRQ